MIRMVYAQKIGYALCALCAFCRLTWISFQPIVYRSTARLVRGKVGYYSPHDKSVNHYNDVIMGEIASQIISLKIVYSSIYSDTDQRKHQSSASLAFVRGIHRRPVNSPHKWSVTRKMFSFDDVTMMWILTYGYAISGNTIMASE